MSHVMLDIETLDTSPSSIVLSIGAVCDEHPDNTFEVFLSIDEQVASYRTLSEGTITWWLTQNETARTQQHDAKRVDVLTAANSFHEWWTAVGGKYVWGNGAAFDVPIVEHLFRGAGHVAPWAFYNVRCYRTLKGLFPNIKMPTKNAHTALGDASNQMQHLLLLLDAVKGAK